MAFALSLMGKDHTMCKELEKASAFSFLCSTQGRPKTALSIVFYRDLALIQQTIRPHSSKHLAEITELAQDRKCWRG